MPFIYGQETYHGAVQGNFAVSPMGAATYTVPIEMPPGVRGMQPQIAITYDSQSGMSGALGGTLGELGTKSNLFGNFGNTLGYKLLSQTSNAIVTNTVFDKDISLSNIIAIGVS